MGHTSKVIESEFEFDLSHITSYSFIFSKVIGPEKFFPYPFFYIFEIVKSIVDAVMQY